MSISLWPSLATYESRLVFVIHDTRGRRDSPSLLRARQRLLRCRQMTNSPPRCKPRAGCSFLGALAENRLRHLPVMDGGQLIGLISIGDVVKATISEQQFIIEQLEHYISGQRD